jgi:hypothetical protein
MYSGPKEMDKRINNDLENITQKSKHRTTSTGFPPRRKQNFVEKYSVICVEMTKYCIGN